MDKKASGTGQASKPESSVPLSLGFSPCLELPYPDPGVLLMIDYNHKLASPKLLLFNVLLKQTRTLLYTL